jgi:hypothetical protein
MTGLFYTSYSAEPSNKARQWIGWNLPFGMRASKPKTSQNQKKKLAAISNEERIHGVTVSDIEKQARPGETYALPRCALRQSA